MNPAQLVELLVVYAVPVVLAITVHEAAHGYAARHFGDDTAWKLGRLTLNPLKHIDPVGTIAMPLLLYMMTGGSFVFGYAKPVPVRFGALRNPRQDMVWVALAGPLSNLLQAMAWAIVLKLLTGQDVQTSFLPSDSWLVLLCKAGVLTNIVMFVFNLFPVPPLDGGRIATGLLPAHAGYQLSRLEPYGFFIVMALLVTGLISDLWMQPLMNFSFALVQAVSGVF